MIRTSGFTPKALERPSGDSGLTEKPPAPEVKQEETELLKHDIPEHHEEFSGISDRSFEEILSQRQPQKPEAPSASEAAIPENPEQQLLQKSSTRKLGNRIFYAFMILFFIGMLYGAVFARGDEDGLLSSLSSINQSYLYEKQTQSLIGNFVTSLTSSSIFLVCTFLSGLCMVGQPIALLMPFIRGLGIGSYMGFLYLVYGTQGILYCTVMILPGVLVTTFTLVLAGREAVRLSNMTLLGFLKETGKIKKKPLTLYLQKYFILFLLLAASAALDSGLAYVFSGVITLG